MRSQWHLGLLLEPSDDVNRVTTHDRRVRPVEGFLQGPRYHLAGLVAEAAGQPPTVALGILEDALSLWQGPAFAEFADEWWAQPEVARLDELRLRVLEQRVDALATLGRDSDCVAELERLTTAHPYRERFVAQYMTALYRTGREAEAHRAFRHFRSFLAEQTGLDPSPRLHDLDRSIAGGREGWTEERRPHRILQPLELTTARSTRLSEIS